MRVFAKDGRARPHAGWVVLGWVCIELGSIATGQTVIGAITRPSLQPTALAVYEAANRVFVADDTTKKIYMFDGGTHAELNSVATSGGIDTMVVHEPSGRLYALGGSVWVIDALTGALIREMPGYRSYGLALDSDAGKLYAISSTSGLRQIDTSNNSETTVPGVDLTGSPSVNPVTHEVFLLGGGGLNIVDGSTLRVTKAAFPGGSHLAVNWLENKVYSGWPGNAIYSRKTNAVTPIGIGPDQNDALEMTFNPAGNRVYTGMEIDGWSTIRPHGYRMESAVSDRRHRRPR